MLGEPEGRLHDRPHLVGEKAGVLIEVGEGLAVPRFK
jgi:hypothetical protein